MHILFRFIFAHSIDATCWRKLLCAILKVLSCASLICALFSLILLAQSIGANCCAPFLKRYPLYPLFSSIFAHFIDAIYWRKLLCAILKTLSCASLICALFSLILLAQSTGANCCAPFLKLYLLYPLFRFIFAHSVDAIYWRKLLCAIFKTLSCAYLISLYFRSFYDTIYWRKLLCAIFKSLSSACLI